MRVCVLIVVLLLGVAGCRPLYMPPVPSNLPAIDDQLRVVNGVFLPSARPALRLSIQSAPNAGWLAVQWFAPNGEALSSQSVRIELAEVPRTVTFEVPQDAMPRGLEGRVRAVVTFNELFVGQWDTVWAQ